MTSSLPAFSKREFPLEATMGACGGGWGGGEATAMVFLKSNIFRLASTYLCIRLGRRPQSLVCTCRRTQRASCSTPRSPHISGPARGSGTRQYLGKEQVSNIASKQHHYLCLPAFIMDVLGRQNRARRKFWIISVFRSRLTFMSHLLQEITDSPWFSGSTVDENKKHV